MIKLSFIKLDIEIMNDTKIKMIRKMPDGAKLFELWIGLMCLAMKSGRPGCIEVGDGIPFTSDMLSAELDIPKNTIELGLSAFEKLKMIEIFEDSTIYLLNFEKHQELLKIEGNRKKERVRKQKYRDKVRMLSHGTVQGQYRDGTFCPTPEKESEEDIDKEEEKRESNSDTPSSFKSYVPPKKPQKHKHGEYNHVLLTDAQYEKLGLDYSESKRTEMIKNLDEYIQMKGAKYKDHNLVMRKWSSDKKDPAPSDFTQEKYDIKYPEYCECGLKKIAGLCPECEAASAEEAHELFKSASFMNGGKK